MSKHYAYRMKHDTGFAPHIDRDLCTLSGCKKTTVEKWAEQGSWVIGIGGKHTLQADKLIYALQVDEKLPINECRLRYPRSSTYLTQERAGPNVLISRRFYYFGDRAINLPKGLGDIVVKGRGCKLVSDEQARRLEAYLAARYQCGKLGRPNNPDLKCTECEPGTQQSRARDTRRGCRARCEEDPLRKGNSKEVQEVSPRG
jgi:hypothetical protein